MKKSNLGNIQTFANQFMPPVNYPKKSKGGQKMEQKNVSNYNEVEKQEVLSKIKAYLKDDEFGFTLATLVNYQEQNENSTKHYEVYETTILVNENTTVAAIDEMRTEKEKLVKTYKTKRGFLEAFLSDEDVTGRRYKIYTRL